MKKIRFSKKVNPLLETLPIESIRALEECQSRLSFDRPLPAEIFLTKGRSILLLPTWDLILIHRYQQRWFWTTKNQVEIENLLPASEVRHFVLSRLLQTDEEGTDPLQTAAEMLVKGAENADRFLLMKDVITIVIGLCLAGLMLLKSPLGLAEKLLNGKSSQPQSNPTQVQPKVQPPK